MEFLEDWDKERMKTKPQTSIKIIFVYRTNIEWLEKLLELSIYQGSWLAICKSIDPMILAKVVGRSKCLGFVKREDVKKKMSLFFLYKKNLGYQRSKPISWPTYGFSTVKDNRVVILYYSMQSIYLRPNKKFIINK